MCIHELYYSVWRGLIPLSLSTRSTAEERWAHLTSDRRWSLDYPSRPGAYCLSAVVQSANRRTNIGYSRPAAQGHV